ncbi:hypothetical protein APHAL10511_002853 [Amanita phalloides]|nr:hypothetical protein APHAL10511_002853 [Amanita phalloides]
MYNQLSSFPIPSSAHFISPSSLCIEFSIRDHVRNVKRRVTKTVRLPSPTSNSYQDVPNDAVLSLASPSTFLRAVLRDVTKSGGSGRFVEIWSNDRLMACKDVSNLHGHFYNDEFISTIAFSPSETALVYIAEQNEPSPDHDPFAKFRFSPSFGEGLPKSRRPRIFIFRWQESETISVLSIQTDRVIHFGQAIFHTETELYATGFEPTPDDRLLGIKYCTNRPMSIFRLSVTGTTDAGEYLTAVHQLTPAHLACRSPRIFTSSASTFLAYLSCAIGGPHSAANSLHLIDLSVSSQPQPKTLVPIVDEPGSASFPGLYPPYNLLTSLVVNHATWNAPKLVTHSIWRSRSTVVLIDAQNGDITNLTPPDDSLWNWQVLTTDGDAKIVCVRSSPSVPHQVVLGTISATLSVHWQVVHEPTLSEELKCALSSIKTEIIPIPGRDPVETIVISKSSITGEIPPCILSPHGGPHVASTTEFNPLHAAFVLEGYTLALPNYTGSLGFGQSSILRLLGQCGSLDVQDCIQSLHHLVKLKHAQLGRGKLFVFGGSHGGFLGAHLIGQFPDIFSAAVLRNPVISVGEMSASDIPDWAYAEFAIPFPVPMRAGHKDPEGLTPEVYQKLYTDEKQLGLTPEIYQKLYTASPIRFAHRVKSDVLLLMGKDDLRVPPAQGYGYYHALRALRLRLRNEETAARVEMLVFDGESHPLDGVECARVGWEASKDWFAQVAKKEEVIHMSNNMMKS